MSRSNSGTPSGSPSLQHRMTQNARSQQSEVVALLQQLQLRREVETMSKYNLDSSYSQAKARAGLEDPFGTLRGSKARRSLREKTSNSLANSCKPKVIHFPSYFLIWIKSFHNLNFFVFRSSYTSTILLELCAPQERAVFLSP